VTDDLEFQTVVGTEALAAPTAPAAPIASDASTDGPPAGPHAGSSGGDGPGDTHGTHGGPERRKAVGRTVLEWAILIIAAVVIAIVIKSFLFQAFYIPSASMEPTLQIGDRVLVNKLSYDLHDVHRGDIMVFASEPNQQWHKAGIEDLVKRVIGLPGETVTQCEGEHVCIDGKLLQENYLPKGTPSIFPSTLPKLGDGADTCAPDSPAGGCKVPAGMVFVMGDNRTNSQDSRANGPVKQSSIVGRVFLRIWPVDRIGLL
jgi:signal peptidase I